MKKLAFLIILLALLLVGCPSSDDYHSTSITKTDSIQSSPVPEPNTFLMLGIGLSAAGFYLIRKR